MLTFLPIIITVVFILVILPMHSTPPRPDRYTRRHRLIHWH